MKTSFLGLLQWSLIRHKQVLPLFSILQILLSLAMVYGLALVIYDLDDVSVVYLSTGAIVMGIIAVGCVLCAQVVSESRQNGVFEYQRSLPVSRMSILMSDILIWGVASAPGIIASFFASVLRFQVGITITPIGILFVLLSLTTMICIGFTIAYYLKPNVVGMVTQLIMISCLLFSPITFPASRLPEWTNIIYSVLPFVPVANLIRYSFFGIGELSYPNVAIVFAWCIACISLSLRALSKRN